MVRLPTATKTISDDRVRRFEAELGQPGRHADREDQVLRVHAGQQQAEAEGLPGREVVDAVHPLRHVRLFARHRPAPPVSDGERQHQRTEDHPPPGDGVGGAAAGRGIAGVRGEVDREAHDGERGDPTEQEHRAVDLRPRREQHQDHGDDRYWADGDMP